MKNKNLLKIADTSFKDHAYLINDPSSHMSYRRFIDVAYVY